MKKIIKYKRYKRNLFCDNNCSEIALNRVEVYFERHYSTYDICDTCLAQFKKEVSEIEVKK
jgi:hypothetical protein